MSCPRCVHPLAAHNIRLPHKIICLDCTCEETVHWLLVPSLAILWAAERIIHWVHSGPR